MVVTIHKLQTLHPLEAEAEQLRMLGSWCAVQARKINNFPVCWMLIEQSRLCWYKQLLYLELYGRTQCRVN